MTSNIEKKEQKEFAQLLQKYQKRIEEKIKQSTSRFGQNHRLQEACEYALLNGGKRFRPALVFMVADALSPGCDVSEAAMTIEYFHTASLIADDLPCMDNDDERRNKPSVHKVFGEAIALLASYALIAAGYGGISAAVEEMKKREGFSSINCHQIGLLALENATYNTGLQGATGGQFLDIFPPDLSLQTLREIIHKKTVSLFEISFVYGWLFSGGQHSDLPLVKRTASHFGMAFQIADDLGDVDQDAKNGRKVNLADVFGFESALQMFHEEIKGYRECIKMLHLESKDLWGLAEILEQQVKDNQPPKS